MKWHEIQRYWQQRYPHLKPRVVAALAKVGVENEAALLQIDPSAFRGLEGVGAATAAQIDSLMSLVRNSAAINPDKPEWPTEDELVQDIHKTLNLLREKVRNLNDRFGGNYRIIDGSFSRRLLFVKGVPKQMFSDYEMREAEDVADTE